MRGQKGISIWLFKSRLIRRAADASALFLYIVAKEEGEENETSGGYLTKKGLRNKRVAAELKARRL